MIRLVRDLETRSEQDISAVGARRYACDPSTEVLMIGWCVDDTPPRAAILCGGSDGRAAVERRVRENGGIVASYAEFITDVTRCDVFIAHNQGFEEALEDYRLPEVAALRARKFCTCTASRSRRLGLPGSLEDACRVLRTPHQKQMDGHGEMQRCAQPRPTWLAGRGGPRWFDDAERLAKVALYCLTDVECERDLDRYLPELSALERARWLHTELVNRRGIPLDAPLIDAMIAAVQYEQSGAMARVREATGDPDFTLTNPAAIIAFCKTRGLWLADLRKETVEAALRAHDDGTRRIDEIARLVLEARREVGGKSSTSKLPRMRGRLMSDGRARDNAIYFGAHTGRLTGDGINTLNLPRPYKKFDQGAVIDFIRRADLNGLRHGQGVSASTAVSAALRGAITAGAGRKLVVGDYNSVEPCFYFTLAQQWDAVEILRQRKSLYIEFGLSVYNRVLDKKADLREYTVSKETVLGCLGPDTLVLTRTGSKPITSITPNDWLWDGVEWVQSKGVVTRGLRSVMNVAGLKLTPDHLVLCGNRWRGASTLKKNDALRYALVTALASLSSPAFGSVYEGGFEAFKSNVPVARRNIKLIRGIFASANLRRVISVPTRKLKTILGHIRDMRLYAQMTSYEVPFSIECPLSSPAAIALGIKTTNTTASAAFESATNSKTEQFSLRIYSRFRVMIIRFYNWIEKTTTRATNEEISDSLIENATWKTEEIASFCNEKSITYDIAYAGPRNRFSVVTDAGLLIVHNCGYALGETSFYHYLTNKGVEIEENEASRIHAAYRKRFPKVKDSWRGLKDAAVAAIRRPGEAYDFNGVQYSSDGWWLVCTLPSGRPFYYPNARLAPGKYGDEVVYEGWRRIDGRPAGWGDVRTHGGLLLENITQATCRDIKDEDELIAEAQPGWEVLMTVYDEIVAGAPVEDVGAAERLRAIMERPREWYPVMPVMAETFEADRYVKH